MEAVIGIGLLGLISVTTLPIMTRSFINLKNHNIKMEMNYVGETIIERIKAFNEDSLDSNIYGTQVSDIIERFNLNDNANFTLYGNNDEPFLIEVKKENHSDKIWKVAFYIYHDKEGSNINHVEYKIYLPKK